MLVLDRRLLAFFGGGKGLLDLCLGHLDLPRQLIDHRCKPLRHLDLGLLFRSKPRGCYETLFGKGLGLHFFFGRFEPFHLRLDKSPVVKQWLLVFDLIALQPYLDLIAQSLELFDLRLQIRLKLFFLALVRRCL